MTAQKTLFILSFIFLSLTFSAQAFAETKGTTLKIDAERSQISFVSEAPAEKIVGTASQVRGNIAWNLAALEASKGTISFPVSTMETGNRLRDRHLKGKDWLNESANPSIEFRLDSLQNITRTTEGDQVIVEADTVGQVTVNGVAAPNRGRVRITILEARKLARIQPAIKIALADHKVEGKKGVVGDKVGETIEIEGLLYGNWE
jgi:polyisoprenoid-binding protein YceI